jgi:hypothetical protein
VSNSVSAPANAMATNTNSDNDMITNAATNAGGRRKKRKAPTIDNLPVHNVLFIHEFIRPTKVSDINFTESKVINCNNSDST